MVSSCRAKKSSGNDRLFVRLCRLFVIAGLLLCTACEALRVGLSQAIHITSSSGSAPAMSQGGYQMELTNKRKDSQPLLANSRKPGLELFDAQAAMFERRAGLPVDHCREIASAVLEIGEVGPGDLLVEVGPGTGQIGQCFGAMVRYIGLDLSARMLDEFRHHLGDRFDNRALVQTNANAGWPISGGVARAVFSSRAIHLLDHEHIAREVFRVASPAGATFIIGRVERDPDSIRARMAREMNERLRHHGFEGRGGEQRNRKLFKAFCRRGAEVLEPVPVATWEVSASARASLDSWRSLTGLGGVPVPALIREEILTRLEAWASEVFDGLDRQFESEETYILKPLRIPPTDGT
jgi:hypothetical protein